MGVPVQALLPGRRPNSAGRDAVYAHTMWTVPYGHILGEINHASLCRSVCMLTQNMAVRYGPHGVRVNCIAPGTIQTPAWKERLDRDPQVFAKLSRWYPLRRVGEPEDVANAAVFLSSAEAGWITGVVLNVDGGLMAGNGMISGEIS